MRTNVEIRADFLKTMMVEDRQEVRSIRKSIYNLTTLLATASFGITAFLLGRDSVLSVSSLICSTTDGLLVLLLWVFFLRLKRDLYRSRQCLFARQELIMGLGTATELTDFNPFPDARSKKPDVNDLELLWLPILATAAIMIKAFVVYRQFP